MIPYYWQYLPLFMQIVGGFCLVWGWCGLLVRRAASQLGHQAGRIRMRNCGCWRRPGALQRALLSGRRPVHPVRRGNGLHDALGGRLPQAASDHRLRLFGFWEMLVYLGFVAVGLYYIVRKGILNWSQDKADL